MHPAPGHGFSFLADEALARRLAGLGVRAEECREQFILGGGPGGQKINKTASTVRLSHGPSGIDVRIQDQRSRSANRRLAWLELAKRLELRKQEATAKAIGEKELARRRRRQKSRGQKVVMIHAKKHRSKTKGRRGRVGEE